MWLLQFALKAAIFFTLFAFALNNQHEAVIHFFFGTAWHAPMVLIVLVAFVLGVATGVLGMVPRWWKHRRLAKQARTDTAPVSMAKNDQTASAADTPHGI
jgi:uncharacterized integral membrane protein